MYYDQLVKFLNQSKTGELKTAGNFMNEYRGLTVKVSFGQGNVSRIPWIAFLKDDQTVSNGIYPVYLYYKQQNILILAYGVSETNDPSFGWPNSEQLKSIDTYFREHNLGKPDRYGNSFVFEVYDLHQQLNETEMDDDLNKIIELYENVFENGNTITNDLEMNKFSVSAFFTKCNEANIEVVKSFAHD